MEAPRPYFSKFWAVLAYSCASVAGMLRSLQNTGRSGAKRTSEHVSCPQRDAQNDQQSALQLFEQEFLPRARGNAGLQRSRSDFGKFWAPLGQFLGLLAARLGSPGSSLCGCAKYIWLNFDKISTEVV